MTASTGGQLRLVPQRRCLRQAARRLWHASYWLAFGAGLACIYARAWDGAIIAACAVGLILCYLHHRA